MQSQRKYNQIFCSLVGFKEIWHRYVIFFFSGQDSYISIGTRTHLLNTIKSTTGFHVAENLKPSSRLKLGCCNFTKISCKNWKIIVVSNNNDNCEVTVNIALDFFDLAGKILLRTNHRTGESLEIKWGSGPVYSSTSPYTLSCIAERCYERFSHVAPMPAGLQGNPDIAASGGCPCVVGRWLHLNWVESQRVWP